MPVKVLLSVFLWVVSMAMPMFACADVSDSTTIGISIVVPERPEEKPCTITLNKQIVLPQLGCRYDIDAFTKVASQQTVTRNNNQGLMSIVITAP